MRNLLFISVLLLPYGGLKDIQLQAGETVIICPATGGFGGAGCVCGAGYGSQSDCDEEE